MRTKSRQEWRDLVVSKLSKNRKRVLSSLLLMSIRPRRTQKWVSKRINLIRKTGSKINREEKAVSTKTTKI
jgi:hypothetical protein|tara:strand:+ start:611 stop:823 length:213 start_codon:yes stop_codon:yes gene_type:complete